MLMGATPVDNFTSPEVSPIIRSVEGRYREQPTEFPAVRIVAAKQQPLAWVTDFQVDGSPVFWLSKSESKPVVDRSVLTDLTVVDVFSLATGDEKLIGSVVKKVDPVALATALIQAQVIMTYVHIESLLTLDKKEKREGGLALHFSGEHVYYTNEENRDPLAFIIVIMDSGSIKLLPA
jgi:hypothetical protein